MGTPTGHPAPLIIIAGLLALGGAAPAQVYTVRDLSTHLGHANYFPNDINDKGQVTGYSRNAALTERRGFLTSPPYTGLVNLGAYGDHTFSEGESINAAGVIVGTSSKVGESIGLIWSGGVLALFPNAQGDNTGNLYAINNQGRMAGNSSGDGREILNGQATPLGTLAGYTFAFPRAVNSSGEIVGYCDAGAPSFKATRWVNGVPSAIADLGGANSRANDIADNGLVVGASEKSGSSNLIAFTAPPGEPVVDIGTFATNSEAIATNGATVVGTSNSAMGPRAFLFEGGELKDLNDLIPPGTGWTLQSARGINAYGQICGYGNFMGETRAFLLTPINPIGGAADWIFTERDNGWTTVTNIPPFEPAEAQWTPGLGYGIRAMDFPDFGFLQSPEVPIRPGRTYRLWVIIATTATAPNAAPQIRLRTFQTGNNQSTLLALDSVSGVLPSGGAGIYEYSFSPLFSGALPVYRFYLDFTHFNPDDDQGSWVYLQRVILAEE